jgi:hypothetical protein
MIGPGDTCTAGDCFCTLYKDTSKWRPHRYAYCHNKGDKCVLDGEFALGCGATEVNCIIGKTCEKCETSATSMIESPGTCAKDAFCKINTLGSHCYAKRAGQHLYVEKDGPMVKDLETQLDGKVLTPKEGCGMTHLGNIACSNKDAIYPVIDDHETCFGKKEGCYCQDPKNLTNFDKCETGEVCSVLGGKATCTGFTIFQYFECKDSSECNCGALANLFGSEFKETQYCFRHPSAKTFSYVEAVEVTNPDNILTDRIIRDYNIFKWKNNIPFKMATKDLKKVYVIQKKGKRTLADVEVQYGL